MFSYNQFDELLGETATLLEDLAKLDQAAAEIKSLSSSVTDTYLRLKTRHDDMCRDLERLRRLEEVLQNYVFMQSALEKAQSEMRTAGLDNPQPLHHPHADARASASPPLHQPARY